jgi:mRNA-degrading endonuclease RelE of RelBE toxin-antitoxin system
MKQRTIEKLEELLKGQISGEPLKGEYKGFKRIRIGKYRLIYSRPRETAYI